MSKEEIQNKISLKRHAISLEKDSNRLAELRNDLKVLELRMQIEVFKERIESLR